MFAVVTFDNEKIAGQKFFNYIKSLKLLLFIKMCLYERFQTLNYVFIFILGIKYRYFILKFLIFCSFVQMFVKPDI